MAEFIVEGNVMVTTPAEGDAPVSAAHADDLERLLAFVVE
jgi:hypothetical protein